MEHGSFDPNALAMISKPDNTDTTLTEAVIIPRCREEFTVEEAKKFIDEIITLLKRLTSLHNLTTLYRTAKQLGRTFSQCRDLQPTLAEYLIEVGYPALAVRYIKQLNNMGVFTNDGTWYSSFYFYSSLWNYTDISNDFSTAIAVSGICHLLNLNIGHPPYIENINSKNVYFLIKASLSILHNIVKVPGNRDMGQYTVGRDALCNILTYENEESLRCVSSLCLAHTIFSHDVQLVLNPVGKRPSLIQLLLSHIYAANNSTKRRYHGFSMPDLMIALSSFMTNESVQPIMLTASLQKISKAGRTPSRMGPTISCLDFLLKLTDNFLQPAITGEAEKEASVAIRTIYHLMFNQELLNQSKLKGCINHMLDLSRYPTVLERTDRALFRVLENLVWQSSQRPCPRVFPIYTLPEPSHLGPIIMSYSSINRLAVAYFVNQLRAAGLPVWNDTEAVVVDHKSAEQLGLSALAGTVMDQKGWLQCLNQATVMIACLTDAYRLNPGCRSELEYFIAANTEEQPKVLIYILMPPKFKPNGWLSQMPDISEALDFTNKRTFIWTLQRLVALAGKPYGITVANEPLDPVTYSSAEGHRGYISIEDLNALKSSSIFLTSSESDKSKPSAITHTADQMMSKGSPRLYGTPAIQHHTSSSTTLTPFHSSGSEGPSQNYGDYPPVASIPSTNLSDSRQTEQKSIEHLPPPMGIQKSADNLVESIPTETLTVAPYDNRSKQLQGFSQYSSDCGLSAQEYLAVNKALDNAAESPIVLLSNGSPATNAINVTLELPKSFDPGNSQVCCSVNVNELVKSDSSKCASKIEEAQTTKSPIMSPVFGKPTCQIDSRNADALKLQKDVSSNKNELLSPADEHQSSHDNRVMQATTSGVSTLSRSSLKSTEGAFEIKEVLRHGDPAEEIPHDKTEVKSNTHSTKYTPETIDKLTLSVDHSKTFSTLRAQCVNDKKVLGTQDSSVQTLSILDDIRTIPTFASSMNTPGATDKHGKNQPYFLSTGAYFPPFSYDVQSPFHRTAGYQDIVRPYVRDWTIAQVNEWLSSKGLQHLSHQLCGALDGILLSQLVCLRHWAPEYFAKCIRSELGLNFIEGLRLVEALEELTKRSR